MQRRSCCCSWGRSLLPRGTIVRRAATNSGVSPDHRTIVLSGRKDLLEQPSLLRLAEHVRVVAEIQEPIDKTLRPVRAVDGLRADAIDGLDQFVEVGVVGKRDGMIDVEAIFR